MAKLTLEQLNKTAKELDNLMGLTPAPPEDGTKEELDAWIKEAAEELQPADKVKTESRTVLETLGVWINPEDRAEPTDDDEEEDGEELDLTKEVDVAEGLKVLKELVKTYDEFKSLRGSITKYKAGDEEELKETMFEELNLEKKEEKPETKVIKMTPSGKEEVPIPKKEEKVEKESKIDRHPLNIMPEINKEDRKILLNEIRENGFDPQLPIILFEEKILDGWQRYMVCQELEIEPIFESFTGNTVEAMQFMLRTNKRRNLTSSQRAAIASQADGILNDLQQEAKEKQKTKGKELEPVHVDKEVAKMYQTNPNYIHKARKLQKENPEEFEKVKAGIKSIPQATKKLTKDNPFFESSKNLAGSLVNKCKDYLKKKVEPKTKTEISNFNNLRDSIDKLIEISKEVF